MRKALKVAGIVGGVATVSCLLIVIGFVAGITGVYDIIDAHSDHDYGEEDVSHDGGD